MHYTQPFWELCLRCLFLCCFLYPIQAKSNPTAETQRYYLDIPKAYLDNPDFKYGFERIDDPPYTRDVFRFQQYALVWRTKAVKGYFKYASADGKTFEPIEKPAIPVGFLIAQRNLVYEWRGDERSANVPTFELAWTCSPSNKQSERIPLEQVFRDVMREKVGNSGGALNASNLHLIIPNQPNLDDPSKTKILLWNKSAATQVSFDPNYRTDSHRTTDSTYQLHIPTADLNQTDFQYGLEKGEFVSSDKMAYTYKPVFYNNEQKYYFKYFKNKSEFAANRNESDTLLQAYFVLTVLGNDLQASDFDFKRVPADRKNRIRPLSQLFIDYFANVRKENIRNAYLFYDTDPDPEEERLNRLVLWNDVLVSNISFEVPQAYFYVDMHKTIDRDVLIRELEEQMAILDGKNKKFVLYISNGESPLIAEDLKAFKQIMLRLWTISPPAPSVGYDGETIKTKIGPDIEFLAQNDVDFHFYASDNLCSNSLAKLVNTILSNQAHDKTNVYIHLEAQDKSDNTYFSKCRYQNDKAALKPDCLKIIRDKNTSCNCP